MGGEGGFAAGCGSTPNAPLTDELDAIDEASAPEENKDHAQDLDRGVLRSDVDPDDRGVRAVEGAGLRRPGGGGRSREDSVGGTAGVEAAPLAGLPQVIREYGEAFRGDWSSGAIDGRSVRGEMFDIAGWLEDPETYPGDSDARVRMGICPAGNGHWSWLYCDEDCVVIRPASEARTAGDSPSGELPPPLPSATADECGDPYWICRTGTCPGDFVEDQDECQHEWELRSEHDTWVCCWCDAETTSPEVAIRPGDATTGEPT